MIDSPGGGAADFTSNASNMATPVPRTGKVKLGVSRAKMAREMRRAAQFSKFRNIELNLVPLVDTFVSIVFFALTAATVGELAPIAKDVNLPTASLGGTALMQLTVGVSGRDLTVAGERVMATAQAAASRSNDAAQPLIIPQLLTVLRAKADSIRDARNIPTGDAVDIPLAVHGDRTMRYDLLSRVLQTARSAGFRNISLQVLNEDAENAEVAAPTPAS